MPGVLAEGKEMSFSRSESQPWWCMELICTETSSDHRAGVHGELWESCTFGGQAWFSRKQSHL